MDNVRKPYVESGVWPVVLDISNLTQTYLEIDASLAKALSKIQVSNMATVPLILATGGSGSEVPFYTIGPKQIGALVPVEDILAKGVRLSVKAAEDGPVVDGYLLINGFNG